MQQTLQAAVVGGVTQVALEGQVDVMLLQVSHQQLPGIKLVSALPAVRDLVHVVVVPLRVDVPLGRAAERGRNERHVAAVIFVVVEAIVGGVSGGGGNPWGRGGGTLGFFLQQGGHHILHHGGHSSLGWGQRLGKRQGVNESWDDGLKDIHHDDDDDDDGDNNGNL